eukprot:gene1215-15585_t
MESSIRLVVKTPNQRFKDIHIDCDLGWTVKKVKEYLADAHPTNPETISQRLIYSGHLLKDEQQLKEVLSKEHESHTLHIVCPSASEANTSENQSNGTPSRTANQSNDANLPESEGVRHRNIGNSSQNAGAPIAMYNQRTSSYPLTNAMSQPPSPITPHTFPATPNLEQAHQGAGLNEQPDGGQPPVNVPGQQEAVGANNAQRNANVPMNAGGAMFDDEDENGDGRRDWLDWVHTFLRLSVMLSIMYFYSSTTRILMISLLGFIVYLYQADQVENDEQNQQNEDNQDRQQPGENENRERSESAEGDEENDSNIPQENIQPPEISPFRAHINLLYTFVTSFFTSLVPQAAQ